MDKIIEKISKTLKLATNNSNENEAQTAILAAQRLMAKYHISEEDINDLVTKKEDIEVIEEFAENEMNNDNWKRKLMVTIARNFRCDVFYRNRKLIIVGEKEDILISKRIYLYAKKSILNSFRHFFKNNYEVNLVSPSLRNKYKREYALGFISGLSEKFEKQKSNSELSLVIINPKVKEYFNTINFRGVRYSRSLYISDRYCYEVGRSKGKNLADIDTRVEGGS